MKNRFHEKNLFDNLIISFFLILLFLFIASFSSGCTLGAIKPFQLDINVNFEEKTATIIGTDQQGEIVASANYKKGEDKWQKSMVLYSR